MLLASCPQLLGGFTQSLFLGVGGLRDRTDQTASVPHSVLCWLFKEWWFSWRLSCSTGMECPLGGDLQYWDEGCPGVTRNSGMGVF